MRESNGKEELTARIILSIKVSCLWRLLPHRQGIAPLVDTERKCTYIRFIFRNGGQLQKQKIQTQIN